MKKKINGYENYWVEDNGNVYNEKTKQYLKGSISENGYKYYRLSLNNNKKMFYAHRLVAEYFLENPNNLPVVNHLDGDKLNNNINNLEWTTYSNNTRHWHENAGIQRRKTEYYVEDLPNEKWKNFNNYQVSSLGRVKHSKKNNLLRPSLSSGYYKVRLSENGMVKDYLLHYLVWTVFNGEITDKTKIIDHIDGNKLNNSIENLRLSSLSDNVLAALYQTKTNSTAKKVGQYDLNGNFIKDFPSAAQAARELHLDASTITKVCRGQNKTHGGFKFQYI